MPNIQADNSFPSEIQEVMINRLSPPEANFTKADNLAERKCMPVITSFGMLMLGDYEFKASLH